MAKVKKSVTIYARVLVCTTTDIEVEETADDGVDCAEAKKIALAEVKDDIAGYDWDYPDGGPEVDDCDIDDDLTEVNDCDEE